MPVNRGPEQTNVWPVVWADFDPADPPAWIVWNRACQLQADDGGPCPRRGAGMHFGVRLCDPHLEAVERIQTGQLIGCPTTTDAENRRRRSPLGGGKPMKKFYRRGYFPDD